jgi:SNF2 family DNA or RNA helicase
MSKGDTRLYLQPEAEEVLNGFPVTLTENNFEEYQWWMSDLLQTHETVLLGAFMGSGKTAVTLHAFWKLWKAGKAKKAFVIAPKNVAADTWPDEIMCWDFARELHYACVVGDEPTRSAALEEEADIVIINRENLRWLYEKKGYRWFKQFQVLIYDEASRLKAGDKKTSGHVRVDGSKSRKRRSEFGYVAKVRQVIQRVWELAGTPNPNGVIDLWGPIYVLDKGQRLGTSRTKFRERWFRYDMYKRTWTPFDHSEGEIMERLKDVFFCLKEEDYLKLPPLQVVDRWVNLSPRHMKMYRDFERTLALEEYDVEAPTNAVLCNKLLQFANGSIYAPEDDDEEGYDSRRKPVAKHVHNRKLDELGSIFEEAGGRPVLIAYSYKFDIHAIKKLYPWVRAYGETPNDLRDWNSGKLRAMILHPASAGHGLNFQHGGNIAVWYGLNWSLELYQQFNKRLHRRGQKGSFVRLYRILAKNTNDARVAANLTEKAVTQDRITDSVRVRLEDIRRAVA